MGYGTLRRISTTSLNKPIPPTGMGSTPELQMGFQQDQQQAPNYVPAIETISGTILPRVKSKSSLPAEVRRRSSTHRRSIYSIDFDIEELQQQFNSDTTDGIDTGSRTTATTKPPPAPDGGYGWVVVVAVHIIQALSMGFLTSLGIFYIEWIEYFESSAAKVGLAVSMSSVVMGIISPLAVGITGMVGTRPLVMSGSVIVFIGLVATSFATSVTQLAFTIGVIAAFGYGLIASTSIIIIPDYFDSNFALANGIAFSGVSTGQLLFPPMSVEFIHWFGGWRGALFIISALSLNIAVCGALLRPVTSLKVNLVPKIKAKDSDIIKRDKSETTTTVTDTLLSRDYSSASTSCYQSTDDLYYPQSNEDKLTEVASCSSFQYPQPGPSEGRLKSSVSDSCLGKSGKRYIKKSISFARREAVTITPMDLSDDSVFEEDEDSEEDNNPIVFTASMQFPANDNCMYSVSNEKDQDVYFKPCVSDYQSTSIPNELPILNPIVCDETVQSITDPTPKMADLDANGRNTVKKFCQKCKDAMKKLLSFLAKSYGIPGVFQSPLFVMMIPAIMSLGVGWYATITNQVARAMSVGVSEGDASFLLSLMGIGSLVGRVGHGWFVDKGFVTKEMLLVLCLGTCSAFTFLICFINLYPIIALLATLQGMTSGISNTLSIVIIKTYAKPNFEESAVGMLYLIWGIGDLIGGVVAGHLYDATGDYNVTFYFAGSAFALTTILSYVTCVLKDRIVLRLYNQYKQRILETDGSSDKLAEMNVTTINEHEEEHDNPVFEMDDEDEKTGNKEEQMKSGINSDDTRTIADLGNGHVLYQIGISDPLSTFHIADSEDANCCPDTSV